MSDGWIRDELPVAFGAVVGHAEHGQVRQTRRTALGPGSYVIGVHLLLFIDPGLVVVPADSAQRAVRLTGGLSLRRLLLVGDALVLGTRTAECRARFR